ncbi:tRNA (adenosine(37)-N6)-dimethylallyltransferase MiaA [Pontiella sulfatireligans]|uniref:tRNA dimethylallyltransferase n=1 Tax=Pontiella sulfatireligans TaxID=2750658 RepID=A0A6C2UIR5_9BACT|nr:tRNA (adenosine(37)-N6)-dimethylallyltransferase MiaA [Pontiella sulfatireligans]VGO20105.1 tRNA dimethylallyltransferase [Pontiella sulfatireligans]
MPSNTQYAVRNTPVAYFLVGTTASGKSSVAQYIAEREGRLIVSADSMNLYRGMDIGTAKPSCSEREKADYAGFDLAEPTEKFSVAAYLDAVKPAFESGREIIVAGGTGLYVKCLTEGFDDVPPENTALRSELEALDFQSLENRAKKEATELFNTLTIDDQQNPRRLIRILERTAGDCEQAQQSSPARQNRAWNSRPKPVIVGLHVEREVLLQRIEQRVEAMYASGLLDEAKGLSELDLSPTALQAIGYAEAFAVLKNEMTLEAAKEKTVIRTRQLAKRQMTWFRNQLNVEWIETAAYQTVGKLAEAVSNAWKRNGATAVQFCG